MACVVVAAVVCAAGRAQAQASADSVEQRCLAPDTTTRWKAVAAEWTMHEGDPVANDSLRRRLLALERRDQALRTVPDLLDSLKVADFAHRMVAADSANAAALLAIVKAYGWPTRSLVGTDGASAAFLIVQHNAAIQQEALRRMLALPAGEVNPSDLAMLQDRILTNTGNAQRYGTQLTLSSDGATLIFDSIADLAHVDERRANAGLVPLSVYICIVRGMYGHDVIDPRAAPRRPPGR